MYGSVASILWIASYYLCVITCHGTTLSMEDLELENRLKMINKPVVKTIKTIYGDTYGCVNFFQQPAFDHPALRNHSYHPKMRPTSYTKRDEIKSSVFDEPSKFWLGGKGCPKGTVPTKRSSKDDLIEAKLAPPLLVHTAVLKTSNGKYNGGKMGFTTWNPTVGPNQYSSSRIEFRGGDDTIQFGWTVNPGLNKDRRTRLFVYTKTPTTGPCFNLQCPGYIHLHPKWPIDSAFNRTSKRGAYAFAADMNIRRDPAKEAWFLEFTLANIVLGFWPQQIFSSMKGEATYVSWGGEVASPPTQALPQMGSGGSHLKRHIFEDAFCYNITVINEKHKVVEPSHTETFTDLPEIYKVKDEGDYRYGKCGRVVLFGGSGHLG